MLFTMSLLWASMVIMFMTLVLLGLGSSVLVSAIKSVSCFT